MRVVVVSNTTMDPLAAWLPDDDVVVGGVGDLVSGLIDPSGPAAASDTDLVLVCPDGDSVLPPLGSAEFLDELADHVARFAAAHPSTMVAVVTLAAPGRGAWAHAGAARHDGRFAARARWEARLAELATATTNVAVIDLRARAEDHGLDMLMTDTYWYLGRIRFTPLGFEVLAAEITELQQGMASRSRKVLVLDLDNTLWGGVVGEEGVAGIALGEEGVGKCHRDFQHHIRDLKEAGVVLIAVSKNDVAVVDEVFDSHPMMALGRDDFVTISADWTPKPDRIAALADGLDLGLDAFVFIDDSPVERAQVAEALPMVAVPEFPERPEELPRWFIDDVVPRWFPRARVLDDDRAKTRQYRARQARKELEVIDLDGFLDSLAIELTFRTDDEALVPRVAQLTQKTNQFNLTTERLSIGAVEALVASPDHGVVTCDYVDRFGAEGTIGVVIVDLAESEVTNVLMSCRVLGRGVEHRMLAEVERMVAKRGHAQLGARFVPTARNGVAAGFLEEAGFKRGPDGDGTSGGTERGWTAVKILDVAGGPGRSSAVGHSDGSGRRRTETKEKV